MIRKQSLRLSLTNIKQRGLDFPLEHGVELVCSSRPRQRVYNGQEHNNPEPFSVKRMR
jgi:hypothetical protein